MKPFRFQMDFTTARPDLDSATTAFDRLTALAEGMGVRPEGGGVFLMPDEEVVPGSPLADDLKRESP